MGYEKYMADMRAPAIFGRTAEANQFNIPSGKLSQTQAELYQRISWVNIAVSNVAKLASTVKFEVKMHDGEKLTQVDNHPFEQLLRKPNPLQSRFEFLETTYAFRKLTGNAYWWLNKSSDKSAPAEMWTISPHKIKPVPDKNLFIKGYLYDPGDGTEMPLEPWEIVHFKEFHPTNPFVGLSPIESIAAQAIGDIEAVKYNAQFFQGGARLPNVLAFADPIADDEWEKLKREAKERGSKRETMFLRNTGAGAVQYIQAGVTQKDMEFLSGRTFTKEEIFALFAPGLASILAVNATEANALAGENTLISKAVYPMQVSMAEKITSEILPLYGENLVGEFEDIRQKDRELQLREEEMFSRTHTVNEIRTEFYSDDPLADERGNMLLVELKPQQTNPQESDESEPEDDFAKDLKSYKRKAIGRLSKKQPLDFTFESEAIDGVQLRRIKNKLKTCKSKDEIAAVFEREKGQHVPAGLDDLIAELKNISEKLIAA